VLGGHRGESILQAPTERVFDDVAGDVPRRVIDAGPFSLARNLLLRGREHRFGIGADVFQVGNRLLEQVAQHVDVHFVAKVVVADLPEEIRPIVVQFQVVDFVVVLEQPAVVRADVESPVSLVDAAEQQAESQPARIGDQRESPHLAPRGVDRLGRKQFPVLAEGDEDDAVQQHLRDVDRRVDALVVGRLSQMADQRDPLVLIAAVQFPAHLSLALVGLPKQDFCPRTLAQEPREQSVAGEQAIKLPEPFRAAHLLKGKVLESARRLFPVIETEAHVVADNSPRAFRDYVEVIPALLHRGPTPGAVTVNVDNGPLQLHEDRWRFFRLSVEQPDRGIRFTAGHRILWPEVPLRFVFRKERKAECLGENVRQKLPLQSRFFHSAELAAFL